ncbi:MAG: leucine-rich repeat domain-containing protein, partial [Oscillospiraceae bacterium]|nr:leucine-rich repeat domain-containing protein [Oscillospiraceae bacterium]
MKQDRIDRLIEITGQIPEAYVAEALPQSVREALRSDGLTEAPEEKKTMKQSIAHYIAGGFAAAAAIGVLVGGGLLISTLNRKPERPGDSGNDTTAVTSLTETTETTTTDGSFVTVTVDNLEFAKYADHAEVIGFVGQPGEGSVTIPAGVGGLYVTRIADAAFRGADALWQVEISSAVTSIGKEAFSDCAGLIIVTLPESVSEIGEEAFALCPNLEAVTFLNDDVQIAERAFMGCDKKKLVLRGGAGIEEYARANGFDYEPLDGTQ